MKKAIIGLSIVSLVALAGSSLANIAANLIAKNQQQPVLNQVDYTSKLNTMMSDFNNLSTQITSQLSNEGLNQLEPHNKQRILNRITTYNNERSTLDTTVNKIKAELKADGCSQQATTKHITWTTYTENDQGLIIDLPDNKNEKEFGYIETPIDRKLDLSGWISWDTEQLKVLNEGIKLEFKSVVSSLDSLQNNIKWLLPSDTNNSLTNDINKIRETYKDIEDNAPICKTASWAQTMKHG